MEYSKLLERIDRNIEKMDNKIESLDARLGSLQMEMAVQINLLEDHQRRSLANEALVEEIRKENEPLKKAAAMWQGAFKLVTVASAAIGLFAALMKLLGKI